MPFIDLGADVLSHLFALTDVYTVLSLARVNRMLHEISSTKQLWLSIVRDLSERRVIDTPSGDIDALSKDALVDEVRRVADGPRTWSAQTTTPPKLLRQITVQSDRSPGGYTELLPGCTYILRYFEESGTLSRSVECLEVHAGRCAWTWSRPGFNVRSATFDFLAGASIAVVALTISTPTDTNQLLFLDVDLITGQSRELGHFTLPSTFLGSPKLWRDFFMFHASQTPANGPGFLLLLNWRTEEYIALTLVPGQPVDCFALLPMHIALARPGPSRSTTSLKLHLYAITDFGPYWRPLSDFNFNNPIDTGRIPSVHLPVADNNLVTAPQTHSVSVSVAESPVHHDIYELTIQVTDVFFPPSLPRLASVLRQLRIGFSTLDRRRNRRVFQGLGMAWIPAQTGHPVFIDWTNRELGHRKNWI
ncbi:hypothetical protein B0H19DRAFT_1352348 [Mycena capillaripes]|nr:hypothetical protein B0H19DRAFT_1352348 [Mycena capillaripes]